MVQMDNVTLLLENYNVTTVVCPEENDACLYKAISMYIPGVPTIFGKDF